MDELRQLCVDPFPNSQRRPKIFDGLDHVVWELSELGIEAEIWVDGSFVTEKIEPDDSDVLVVISNQSYRVATPDQKRHIKDLKDATGFKEKFYCHVFVHIDDDGPHAEWMRAYWIHQFGFSRQEEMKGMAVISTPTQGS